MKKQIALALGLAIATSTLVAPVQEAKAGVLIGWGGAFMHQYGKTEGMRRAGSIIAWSGLGIALVGIPFGLFGVGIAVLSVDKALPSDALESMLAQKYTFIDDRSVIAELAQEIQSAFLATPVESSEVTQVQLRVPEAKVRAILARTDLSNENLEKVVTELR